MDPLVPGGPWFRRCPRLAIGVTIALFAAVTALRLLVGDERDAAGLLYALPVALAAMAFGRRVGAAAAIAAAALIGVWVAASDEAPLSVLGWSSRTVPLLLLGLLVGAAADAADDASRARLELAVAASRRRDAAEINDEILQRLTVAKWRLEAGAGDAAAELLDEVMGEAQQLVSSLLEGCELDDRMHVRPVPRPTAPASGAAVSGRRPGDRR